MAVNLARPEAASLHPVAGVRVGVAAAGIKKPGRKDLLLIALDPGATVAGVFTRNRFCAAPVLVAREHLASGSAIRALVVNTGNANAGTGDDGLARARKVCAAAAAQLGCRPVEVLPFSTGVIMEPLPVDRIVTGLPAAAAALTADAWLDAAEAIMTTDTVPKARSRTRRRRQAHGDRHRHRQGRRNDPAGHGDDARVHRDRRAALDRRRAGHARPRDRSFVQLHHRGRRHLDERRVHADGERRRGRLDPRARQPRVRRRSRRGDRDRRLARAGDRARRRGRDQVHHRACRGRALGGGVPRASPTRSRTRRW